MEGLTKPAITRLARRAGVKSMGDDCTNAVKNLIDLRMHEVIDNIIIMSEQSNKKTVMENDVYDALMFMGVNVAKRGY